MTYDDLEDIYELSPLQQGILFHSLYEPGSGVYLIQWSCRMQGELNLVAFKQAWEQVIGRHQVLRTSYVWDAVEKPLQIVHRHVGLPLVSYDWRDLTDAQQEEQLATLLAADRRRGFRLNTPPLMRLTLIRTGSDTWRFVWSFHQLLLDGWSVGLLLRDVLTLYEALSTGSGHVPEVPRPYRHYITWIQQQDVGKAEEYWRRVLAKMDEQTRLSPLPEDLTEFGYAEAEFSLSEQQTDELSTLAREHRLTLNTLVQAAWALLLSRYSGDDDILFGVTVSGRPPDLDGVESMVGLFINTLPARVQIRQGEALLPWLRSLQNQQIEQRQYEYSALTEIKRWAGIQSDAPLFESIVVFENYPLEASLLERVSRLRIGQTRALENTNYPMALVACPGRQLVLRVLYDQRYYDSKMAVQVLHDLGGLLDSFPARITSQEPAGLLQPLGEAPMAPTVLGPLVERPTDVCIHSLFEAQARQTPDVLAVVSDASALTYAELDAKSNQLAHFLQKRGVGPDIIVGTFLERSPELVTAILGILKAGGAYLPLDPAYPRARNAYILQDAQAPVLLSERGLIDALPECPGDVILIDEAWPAITQEAATAPRSETAPDHLAYIIYTSGSTGKPKGVLGTHRGMVNRLLWMAEAYPLETQEVSCLKTSVAFVDSIGELFGSLIGGATSLVISRDTLADLPRFMDILRRKHVTRFVVVPSLLRAMFSVDAAADGLPDLKLCVSSGEQLTRHIVEQLRIAAPDATLVNLYGSTEVAADATWFNTRKSETRRDKVSLGQPIPNMSVYVLDDDLDPVPVGVPGEICIAGIGLARGYLGLPGLTAERFVPNPYSETPGDRLYRMGDSGRFLPDGTLEYLGRLDHQCKIRGFRIELGEIEAALARHPAVRDAAVIAREGPNGEKTLVAYVVSRDGVPCDPQLLREFLKETLPVYMVPARFVLLEGLPLTPSGKVNRNALLSLHPPGGDAQPIANSPRNVLEIQLQRIWEEILGPQPIGVTANFFELGGHSLSAITLVVRIEQVTGKRLPLSALFEDPTIEHLATVLTRDDTGDSLLSLVPLQHAGTGHPFFCVHPADGSVYCYLELARVLDVRRPFYALQYPMWRGDVAPLQSIEAMAAHYVREIRRVQPTGPYLIGGWSLGGMVAFEMARQLHAERGEVEDLLLLDSIPSTMELGPPIEDDAELLFRLARNLAVDATKIGLTLESVEGIPSRDRVAYIIEHVRHAGVALPGDLDTIRQMLNTHKLTVRAALDYKPDVYHGRARLFQSQAWLASEADAIVAEWRRLVRGPVTVYEVPGDHFTILRTPHVTVLADILRTVL